MILRTLFESKVLQPRNVHNYLADFDVKLYSLRASRGTAEESVWVDMLSADPTCTDEFVV